MRARKKKKILVFVFSFVVLVAVFFVFKLGVLNSSLDTALSTVGFDSKISRVVYLDWQSYNVQYGNGARIGKGGDLLSSLNMTFTDEHSSIRVPKLELTPKLYDYQRGICISTRKTSTKTACCQTLGYHGIMNPPSSGYDYCFNHEVRNASLVRFTVNGVNIPLIKVSDGVWVSADFSEVANNLCSGNNWIENSECRLTTVIQNGAVDGSRVSVSTNYTVKDNVELLQSRGVIFPVVVVPEVPPPVLNVTENVSLEIPVNNSVSNNSSVPVEYVEAERGVLQEYWWVFLIFLLVAFIVGEFVTRK